MSCNESLTLQAYFDGELDGGAALALERHLAGCADCAALLKDLEATRALMRGQAPYHRADAKLRRTVLQSLDGPSPRRRLDGRWGFLTGAVSGAGAMAALLLLLAAPQTDMVAGEVMNAHLRSLMPDHLIEVASSDRHTVKPWFAGHADVSPPAVDFAAQGFALVGGRADYVDGRRAAVLVYRHGAHIINVFAWAAGSGAMPERDTRKGFHLLFWKSGDLIFCAISDAAPEELAQLAGLIRSERE
jgi:anti-sigma factor RsiW